MALDALQVLGGNGYINEYPTGEFFFPFLFFFFFRVGLRARGGRRWKKKTLTTAFSLFSLSKNTKLGRILRDAKLYEIGAGTSEIRRLVIGRELMREVAE